MNSTNKKAFMVSAMKSGSGKTLITLGLINTFKKKGESISIYKTGPDYIDTIGQMNLKTSFIGTLQVIQPS